jgi:hypothetical protein
VSKVDELIEAARLHFNESAILLGTPTMDEGQWDKAISEPLYEPRMELVRQEDKQYPDRICAWCFHPRSSDECQFAAKHTPYREMFSGLGG